MLGSGKMVGFVLTADYEKARAFYEGKLSFEFVSQDQYALVMKVGGHQVRIVRDPHFVPLRSTVLGWEVGIKWPGSKTRTETFFPSVNITDEAAAFQFSPMRAPIGC